MVESKVLSESTVMMMDSWSRWARGLDAYSSLWYPSASLESRLSVDNNVWESGAVSTMSTSVVVLDAERVEAAVQVVILPPLYKKVLGWNSQRWCLSSVKPI